MVKYHVGETWQNFWPFLQRTMKIAPPSRWQARLRICSCSCQQQNLNLQFRKLRRHWKKSTGLMWLIFLIGRLQVGLLSENKESRNNKTESLRIIKNFPWFPKTQLSWMNLYTFFCRGGTQCLPIANHYFTPFLPTLFPSNINHLDPSM